MYVQFKCFQCESIQRTKIHSYSWNQEKKPFKIKELCEHFSDIELKWIAKWGFFTLGWKVTIYDVSVDCKKHNEHNEYKRRIYFANETFQRGEKFNKGVNQYEEIQECCNNIIVYSAYEGDFGCSDDGKIRQQKINNYIEEIKADEEKLKKLKEEEEKLEKEEKLRKQKEEEERREREEEEKKEKEKEQRRRSQYEKENKEMLEIIKQQEKEEKELNKRVNIGASWIEEQMSQMISEANATYSKNISFNAQKTIKANFQCQAVKS